ncbi:unnamed protein product [Macrosiphum euphorbiae]|uniref:Uncharacterized protein n=1 Tax=Macrosiphum euphorbiae TaxID=13131 RepID=A0AAV0X948_9HEMI|nr:unnamed protein product [Macrosiphum euphorbiae]
MAIINLSSRDLFAEIGVASALLRADEKLATAHCVSEDFQMGRGIAINFKLAPLRVESRVFCAASNNAAEPREVLILPVDLVSASENSTLDRCLTHFNLKDE